MDFKVGDLVRCKDNQENTYSITNPETICRVIEIQPSRKGGSLHVEVVSSTSSFSNSFIKSKHWVNPEYFILEKEAKYLQLNDILKNKGM